MNAPFAFILSIYVRIEILDNSTTQVKLWKVRPNNFPK